MSRILRRPVDKRRQPRVGSSSFSLSGRAGIVFLDIDGVLNSPDWFGHWPPKDELTAGIETTDRSQPSGSRVTGLLDEHVEQILAILADDRPAPSELPATLQT